MIGRWKNRVVRVFLSSTFNDMKMEREILAREVFPVLRKYCSERNIVFSYVDLRWGITDEVLFVVLLCFRVGVV